MADFEVCPPGSLERLRKLDSTPDPVVAELIERPFAYAYRYPSFPPVGATVIRFNGGREVNGSKPIEAIPLYSAAQLTALSERVAVLTEALSDARNAIASLDEFALGGVDVADTHSGGSVGQYGIRDELLAKLDAAANGETK